MNRHTQTCNFAYVLEPVQYLCELNVLIQASQLWAGNTLPIFCSEALLATDTYKNDYDNIVDIINMIILAEFIVPMYAISQKSASLIPPDSGSGAYSQSSRDLYGKQEEAELYSIF